MPIPTYDRCIEPVLRYLAEHPEGVPISNVRDAVATKLGITAEEREIPLPSGAQPVWHSRIGWAHDRIKRAGFSTSVRRGFWKITAEGVAFVKQHAKLTEEQIENLAYVAPDAPALKPKEGAPPAAVAPAPPQTESPAERIDRAIAEVNDSVARDLLELVAASKPAFFERLVLELLHAMGYGATRDDLQQVGGGGDGGIDGVISLDKLGLEKVYVQAKRWKNKVSSPEIRGFMGALQLQGANKGVFLTAGEFTVDALETASKARGSIVLVDGARLTRLMIEHGVGVSKRSLEIPRVDSDYFDDE